MAVPGSRSSNFLPKVDADEIKCWGKGRKGLHSGCVNTVCKGQRGREHGTLEEVTGEWRAAATRGREKPVVCKSALPTRLFVKCCALPRETEGDAP